MTLEEINQLINIRQYMMTCVNNMSLDHKTTGKVSKMLSLLDKRILEKLMTTEFQDFLNKEE